MLQSTDMQRVRYDLPTKRQAFNHVVLKSEGKKLSLVSSVIKSPYFCV